MADIFQEVEEDLRQERFQRLWKRYGRIVIALAVLIVLAVAGYQAWTAWQDSQRLDLSDRYAAAEAAAGGGDAGAFAALSDPTADDLRLLAAFEAARRAQEKGDTDTAIAGWQAIAQRGVDDGLGAAATYLAASAAVAAGDLATARPLIDSLVATPNHAFHALGRELSAGVALADGDLDAARADLRAIGEDLAAPAGLTLRARQLLEALGGEAEE